MVEASRKLLLDSSFIVSLFYGNEESINKAQEILPSLITVDHIYINNYVLSEVLTVLSQRIGKKKTKEAIDVLYSNRVELVNVSRAAEGNTFDEFLKIKKKNVSFVDLMLVMHAKEKDIDAILTLDKHFSYLGKRYNIEVLCPK